jgi:hypothetical protein
MGDVMGDVASFFSFLVADLMSAPPIRLPSVPGRTGRGSSAEKRGHLRVVDESGEDYLYPKEFFARVELPEDTERALATTGTPRSACAH